MASKNPSKLLVPAGVGGAGLLLYLRYQQTGHLGLLDWIIAGSILAMTVLVMLASWLRLAADQEPEETPAGSRHFKWLLVMALLPVFLWMLYGDSGDVLDVLTRPGDREPSAEAPGNAMDSPRTIRTQAGEPDDTGWFPALSTAGGFSVHLPDRFNEVISTMEMDGRPTPVVIVGARMAELRFVALAARWSGGKQDLKTRARDAVKSLGGFKSIAVSREGWFEDKFPLIEMEMSTRVTRGLARVIATDEAVYGLAVEGPELTDTMRAAAGRFFDSFAIVTSDPTALMNLNRADGGEPNQ